MKKLKTKNLNIGIGLESKQTVDQVHEETRMIKRRLMDLIIKEWYEQLYTQNKSKIGKIF